MKVRTLAVLGIFITFIWISCTSPIMAKLNYENIDLETNLDATETTVRRRTSVSPVSTPRKRPVPVPRPRSMTGTKMKQTPPPVPKKSQKVLQRNNATQRSLTGNYINPVYEYMSISSR